MYLATCHKIYPPVNKLNFSFVQAPLPPKNNVERASLRPDKSKKTINFVFRGGGRGEASLCDVKN